MPGDGVGLPVGQLRGQPDSLLALPESMHAFRTPMGRDHPDHRILRHVALEHRGDLDLYDVAVDVERLDGRDLAANDRIGLAHRIPHRDGLPARGRGFTGQAAEVHPQAPAGDQTAGGAGIERGQSDQSRLSLLVILSARPTLAEVPLSHQTSRGDVWPVIRGAHGRPICRRP